MNDIQFWYPVVYGDTNGETVVRKQGAIRVINLEQEPYEVDLSADGYSYHLIFGSQINGHFLCVPNWNTGCELGPYEDRFWNIESISGTGRISITGTYAIGNALDLLAKIIKLQG